MFDPHENFSYGILDNSPGTAGTSFELQSGQGADFPSSGSYNATVWPTGVQPTRANAEIVRVTARSTDTLTVTREQEGTTAIDVAAGYQIAMTITDKVITDIETAVAARVQDTGDTMTGDLILSGGKVGVEKTPGSAIGVDVLVDSTPLTQGIRVEADTSSRLGLSSYVTGDSNVRFSFQSGGTLNWGSGSGAADTTLYRGGTNRLQTEDEFRVSQAADTTIGLSLLVTGDTVRRFQVTQAGAISWGTGADAVDTNLYRSAADTLKTDDNLIVGGNLTFAGKATVALTTYTPTLTNITLGTGGTVTGYYESVGNFTDVTIVITLGTSPTVGTDAKVSLPDTANAAIGFSHPIGLIMAVDANTSTFYPATMWLENSTTARMLFNKTDGTYGTVAGTATNIPFTWAVNDVMRITLRYPRA
jgi:hypothetical protein